MRPSPIRASTTQKSFCAPNASGIALLLATVLFASAVVGTGNDQTSRPLNRTQVLGLVAGGVANQRVVMLVKERGINFYPTRQYLAELRGAGADNSLIKTVEEAAPRSEERRVGKEC